MSQWIDSHTHIDIMDKNPANWPYILSEAKNSGLYALINISTEISSFLRGKKLSQLSPDFVFHTAGLYPSHATSYNKTMRQALTDQLDEGTAIAIGECGIDYHWDYGAPDQQKHLFREQIRLAKDYNLPLIVHARNSYEDTLSVLREEKPHSGVVMHCWSGSAEEVKGFLDIGAYISFAGNVTYKKATDLQDSAQVVPLSKILIETDAPYLTPVPHRGKRNSPGLIRHTADFIADLKGVSVDDISQNTCQNAINLFKLPINITRT